MLKAWVDTPVPPHGTRIIAALVVLRERGPVPYLVWRRETQTGRRPWHWTRIDEQHSARGVGRFATRSAAGSCVIRSPASIAVRSRQARGSELIEAF